MDDLIADMALCRFEQLLTDDLAQDTSSTSNSDPMLDSLSCADKWQPSKPMSIFQVQAKNGWVQHGAKAWGLVKSCSGSSISEHQAKRIYKVQTWCSQW